MKLSILCGGECVNSSFSYPVMNINFDCIVVFQESVVLTYVNGQLTLYHKNQTEEIKILSKSPPSIEPAFKDLSK